ncbi:hypothetical protein UFOVP1361_57 [uncultured Caudovirales phage]|uniref:Uncharacterized protein n=1 Tax=uncultured Caudovirales phage TaxID=2100421 RepID=A0A6J5S4E4_9CAUD|nr:hypothetical protein UFOVP1361_57 [uncultured Caudovirales phage]
MTEETIEQTTIDAPTNDINELPESTESTENYDPVDTDLNHEESAEDDNYEDKDISEIPLPEVKTKTKSDHIKNRLLLKKEKELAKERAEKENLLRIIQSQNQNSPAQQQNNFDIKKPNKNDFEDEDDYIDARIEYANAIKHAQYEQNNRLQQSNALKMKVVQKFDDMNARGAEKYEDYEELVEPIYSSTGGFPENEGMAIAIFNSEYDVDINYFLAKNMTHARSIAKLPPMQAQKKIWEIEKRFADLKKKPVAKAGVRIIEPISTSASHHTQDISKMSQKQIDDLWNNDRKKWNKLYKEQFKKKRY